ncbi:LysR family transcriptional regulator [Litorilituus lipolyticus]|uniref:LysR family transcriptional regulator n=1 Tax=Litorilituus lipolyticus TaxID=2491017 RepID=A0A502KLN9_9GAMM|nr:LysR family transcriptional regulator [Litorilituus lipolyticus]TPH12492.1 LysR family transcriptional regulator [Litorilituus lipolyticus]
MNSVSWDDYKIAYQVAIDGSLSKAAVSLGVNHATVLRRINQLEQNLEVTLFIRHQRGYKLTDAGILLLDEMPEIITNFASLENRLQNVEGTISGELRITTVSSFSSTITPSLKTFCAAFPKIRLKLISTDEIIPLDTGAAHISLRAGPCPDGVDLIVKELTQLNTQYYARQDYVEKYGMPASIAQFKEHQWILPSSDKHRIPFVSFIVEHINKENIVFQSNHFPDIHQAVFSGMGIGPLAENQANSHEGLVKMKVKLPKASESIWFVYHKDLKHSIRIKSFYDFLTTSLTKQN